MRTYVVDGGGISCSDEDELWTVDWFRCVMLTNVAMNCTVLLYKQAKHRHWQDAQLPKQVIYTRDLIHPEVQPLPSATDSHLHRTCGNGFEVSAGNKLAELLCSLRLDSYKITAGRKLLNYAGRLLNNRVGLKAPSFSMKKQQEVL